MESIIVFAPGSEVEVPEGCVGKITHAQVSKAYDGFCVKYCVVYWDGNKRTEYWVEAYELARIQRVNAEKLKIGFGTK